MPAVSITCVPFSMENQEPAMLSTDYCFWDWPQSPLSGAFVVYMYWIQVYFGSGLWPRGKCKSSRSYKCQPTSVSNTHRSVNKLYATNSTGDRGLRILKWKIVLMALSCSLKDSHLAEFAELGGDYVLRLAIGAASTQKRHVTAVWKLICTEADKILAQEQPIAVHNAWTVWSFVPRCRWLASILKNWHSSLIRACCNIEAYRLVICLSASLGK